MQKSILSDDNAERKVLHKTRISTGTHNYFLELKESDNGSKYIVIDQTSRSGNNQYSSVKMRIFEDEILEFHRQFKKMVKLMVEDDL
ncbi:MAG: hypothetical protein QM487_10215 [Candidatus Marithrix sp.]